jgi:solute carrier family 31 (copper transporter), member 1
MLWNWYTIDACFLSRTWHVRSAGAFAGSCIGVILLVTALELLRRSQREFDRYLHGSAPPAPAAPANGGDASSGEADFNKSGTLKSRLLAPSRSMTTPRLKLWQHAIRSGLYTLQFAVGYFVMLLAMYYNGALYSFTQPIWIYG